MSAAPTTIARLQADQTTARQIADALVEVIDPETTAVSSAEAADGWVVEIHFRDPPDEAAFRDLIDPIAGPAAGTLSFASVAATDWVKQSLEGLKPVDAGRFIVHGAHDRGEVPPARIGIEIEAALAFGTGHHGTTRGCLLAFDAIAKRKAPRRILDIGTGSGVLAIAAAKRLRTHVLASDIDRQAVVAARGNARLNHVASWVEMIHASGLSARRFGVSAPYDLIFANILLAPLKRMAAPASRLIAPGGCIILSGLLRADAPAALSAYGAQGLRLERRIDLEGWATLVMRKP